MHRNDELGFSLMEAIVGALIAVIAVIGLAHTFGLGRSMVDRYDVGRVALGVAQARIEALGVSPFTSSDLSLGTHPGLPIPFVVDGRTMGGEWWVVDPVDDPNIPGTSDMKKLTVYVSFTHSSMTDTVRLGRLIPLP